MVKDRGDKIWYDSLIRLESNMLLVSLNVSLGEIRVNLYNSFNK